MNFNDKNFTAQKIRDQYIKKEDTALDSLSRLDRKVKAPANIFGYIFGSISALVMGSGMSLVMTDIGTKVGISNAMPLGIVIGSVGILMAVLTYPIYKGILSSRKKKYSGRIIALSDEIMRG